MSHPIIALWSHPRSMSTAFERIMRARGDLICLHEPFMYDYYIHRSKRRMPHFDATDSHPRTYGAIRDMILAKAERGPVFFKDMSYYVMPHLLDDQAWIGRLTHSFLVRDPKAAIVSYARLDPDFTAEELGLEAQWQHLSAILGRTERHPVVIESESVQADPPGAMRRYWQAVGLDDRPCALEWQGEAPSDWQQVAGWHVDVVSSTSVRPLTTAKAQEIEARFEQLATDHPRFAAMLAHHRPYYDKLKAHGAA